MILVIGSFRFPNGLFNVMFGIVCPKNKQMTLSVHCITLKVNTLALRFIVYQLPCVRQHPHVMCLFVVQLHPREYVQIGKAINTLPVTLLSQVSSFKLNFDWKVHCQLIMV